MTIGNPPPPAFRIRCMVCDKLVERVTWWHDQQENCHRIKVDCHGDTDSMELTPRMLVSTRDVDQLYAQEGQAFTTKRICNEK